MRNRLSTATAVLIGLILGQSAFGLSFHRHRKKPAPTQDEIMLIALHAGVVSCTMHPEDSTFMFVSGKGKGTGWRKMSCEDFMDIVDTINEPKRDPSPLLSTGE